MVAGVAEMAWNGPWKQPAISSHSTEAPLVYVARASDYCCCCCRRRHRRRRSRRRDDGK